MTEATVGKKPFFWSTRPHTIYGANASGKSNVIEAFYYMMTHVAESFANGGEADDKKSRTKKSRYTPDTDIRH